MQLSTKSTIGKVFVLRIIGKMLGGPDTGEMDEKIGQALQERQGLIIDLTACTWVNSSGLSILICRYEQFHKAKLPIVLVYGKNDQVERILVLSRLSEVFDIHETVEQAEKAIQQKLQ